MDKATLARINEPNEHGFAAVALCGSTDHPGRDVTDTWHINGYHGCGVGYLFVDADGSPIAIEYAEVADPAAWEADRRGRYVETDDGGLAICVSFSCYTACWKADEFRAL